MATNGGSVFYRANNPLATGIFTPYGEVRIDRLPELEQNTAGFILAKRWIAEHPAGFLKLAAMKFLYLVKDDKYGAYWAVLRGQGKNEVDALAGSSGARLAAYQVTEWLSWAFWILAVAWTVRLVAPLAFRGTIAQQEPLAPLVYPMLYCAVVFSVFESASRQHAIAAATLLILAAASIVRVRPAGAPHQAAPARGVTAELDA